MLAVVSPAKRLNLDSAAPEFSFTQPEFLDETDALVTTARGLGVPDLRELMGISENLAQLCHDRFQSYATPFTPGPTKQAALMFSGDVYQGLDAETLAPADLEWAQDRLAILSGLYGLLRPLDLTHPYRLEMGTKMENSRGKTLYAFWGSRISERINALTAGHQDKSLINLASNEYFSAIDKSALEVPIINVDFKEWKGDKLRTISFYAKKARGQMARFMVERRLEAPEQLQAFDVDGYAFDTDRSRSDHLVFTRGG